MEYTTEIVVRFKFFEEMLAEAHNLILIQQNMIETLKKGLEEKTKKITNLEVKIEILEADRENRESSK